MSIARAVVVGLALCLAPVSARADTQKAWTAAKANLPAITEVVVGMDVAALTKSSLFRMAFPMLLAQKPDIKNGLELIKATCKIDPLASIDGLVAGTDKEQEQGVLFIALRGLDEGKLVTCLQAIGAAKDKDTKVTVAKDGSITAITIGTGTFYVRWFGKDVVAFAIAAENKEQLQVWTGGKKGLAKSVVGGMVAKLDTRSAIWAASGVDRDVEGMKMKGGYGGLALAKGVFEIDMHLVLPSPMDATTVADKASAELVTKTNGAGLAPALKPVLESVKITSAGSDVVIKAAIPESSLLSIAGALMAN